MAWMDLDSRIEPTIGPYEVYEDRLMAYKAAFESFLTVADPEASAELERLKDAMPELERNLPIADRHKNLDRGFESPIRVVDVVYTAGDTRAGTQTIAFNLPNDVRVHEQKGSKKVMLRNVMQAKFDKVLAPIGAEVLTEELQGNLAFQPWFVRVLMHELAHGLGPSTVTLPSGERTSVNQALQERHSAIEEAKADAAGLHSLTVLAEKGYCDEEFVRYAFLGHIADLFRSVRFGTNSAHGMAGMIQFNYLVEKGAVRYDEANGRYTADYDLPVSANRGPAPEPLTLQAGGPNGGAGEILRRKGAMDPGRRGGTPFKLPSGEGRGRDRRGKWPLHRGLRPLVSANRELAHELLTLQAEGSYERAGEILERHGTMSPEMQGVIDRLADNVPVDIRPQYTVLEKMVGW